MSGELMLDVGQVNELKMAFRRAGWTNEEIKRLCDGDTLSHVRGVLRGHAEIKVVEHLIDLDADPFIPDGWKVVEHRKGGQFKWDPKKVSLYLYKDQKNNKFIEGHKLRKKLADKRVLNANSIDYLLANPILIPKEWKNGYTFFWGTIYRGHNGGLLVRCLDWDGRSWHGYWFCLDDVWDSDDFAALLVE